jgi:hypothetical protein
VFDRCVRPRGQVALGRSHASYLSPGGTVSCWGDNTGLPVEGIDRYNLCQCDCTLRKRAMPLALKMGLFYLACWLACRSIALARASKSPPS